jgi:hypothetical protein
MLRHRQWRGKGEFGMKDRFALANILLACVPGRRTAECDSWEAQTVIRLPIGGSFVARVRFAV